ncbi:NUDIX hydrolase [Bacterioplanoides sp.]|uniref:NUDIX hydrolase n=1 Tax=Bacterioplanoides sp. TaxID=2066072 RepID=UPI003B5A89F1
MKFCSHCATPVEVKTPEGDNRPRFVCPGCDTIFYQNPRIVAGTLPVYRNGDLHQILLCKRAIEPRKGYWTLPAGFMENGESTVQAAERETLEEANARVISQSAFTMISVPHINQVHLFYLADLPEPEFSSGSESLEVALFDEKDIPWKEIAFPTVARTLKHYFANQHDPQELQRCASSVIELDQALKKLEEEEKQRYKSANRQTS